MEFVVYILFSETGKRFYVGFSSDIIKRIYWHNSSRKGFTTRFRPWKVVYIEFFADKKMAMEREAFFKSGKGREWYKSRFNEVAGFIAID